MPEIIAMPAQKLKSGFGVNCFEAAKWQGIDFCDKDLYQSTLQISFAKNFA